MKPSDFKVGDRVRVTDYRPNHLYSGTAGTIYQISPDCCYIKDHTGQSYGFPFCDSTIELVNDWHAAMISNTNAQLSPQSPQTQTTQQKEDNMAGAHRVKWQDVDGPAKRRTLAMPYVLLLIPFAYADGKILPHNVFVECYYRNEPLMDADDKLFFPALLNTGYWAGLSLDSWICTTGVNLNTVNYVNGNTRRLWKTIALLRDYFSAATFNWEWKYNWKAYLEWNKADPRITNLDTWEKETANDPSFVLGVEWMPAKRNLKETINSTLDKINSRLRPKLTSDYLHSIIINQGHHERRY